MKDNGRDRGIMSDTIFDLSLELLRKTVDLGTQRELNLQGNGEPTLDKQLPARARRAKDILGDRKLRMCTNGIGVTRELLIKLMDSGVDQIDVSPHSPYHLRKLAPIFQELKIMSVINLGAITQPHNWANQIEEEHRVPEVNLPRLACSSLLEGWGYISIEGFISPCCYDYLLEGSMSHVSDENALECYIEPYGLCENCHNYTAYNSLMNQRVA
jgi:hypothetical protein